jgi:hypothetical protein
MFLCPSPGCDKRFETVPGIRSHWRSLNGHSGECPKLIATDLLATETPLPNIQRSDDPKDNDLIEMMGLTDGNVDTRSSGRFARASGLGAERRGEVYSPIPSSILAGNNFGSGCAWCHKPGSLGRGGRSFFCVMHERN